MRSQFIEFEGEEAIAFLFWGGDRFSLLIHSLLIQEDRA